MKISVHNCKSFEFAARKTRVPRGKTVVFSGRNGKPSPLEAKDNNNQGFSLRSMLKGLFGILVVVGLPIAFIGSYKSSDSKLQKMTQPKKNKILVEKAGPKLNTPQLNRH